ncbi:hypothetical protein M011DRAFT_496567 [Sporormia fimetaria CBS 119925]|uniref:Uncharacterized protein n=1 Tax=Sporormia fimetaria CBS 119925 TaxID=1340428 RepID=A0A6A6V0A6_9PLEO|nr:hypothetical protein M011DRAFT_496567 [Sporormia fimetaria CBS 119925]
MAAATDSKPVLAALKTPLSATYPSELRSPMVYSASTPTFIKREESLKTPITPPVAYLDFLKSLSPVIMSPLNTGTSTKFVFGADRPSLTPSTSSGSFTPTSAPTEKPAEKESEKESPSSSRSSSCTCDTSKPEPPMSAPPTKVTTVAIPPPSPFSRPQTARTPRLYIPQSPYSPSGVRSPASAHSAKSPFSAASPRTWDLDKKPGRTRRVSVREVVTRTVTYSSTNTPVDGKAPQFPQIDPAPRGKRRKIE